MRYRKTSTILNLSSQANLCLSNKASVLQFNCVVIMGLDYINKKRIKRANIPLVIFIKKNGELEIGGIDKTTLRDKSKVKIYTDRKVTKSGDNTESNITAKGDNTTGDINIDDSKIENFVDNETN